MPYPIYPANFPDPTWQYSQGITTYPERAQMECGWTRQRRQWIAQGSSVSLEFIMDTATFDTWMDWVYEFGYDFFSIELDQFGGTRPLQDIRFATPIQYAYDAFDQVVVSVAGEFALDVPPP
jgi:hypothetical protein